MALTSTQRTLAITGLVVACGAGIYALGSTQAAGAATQHPATVTLTGGTTGTTSNGITVTGTGNATGTPNELQLNLSVNTRASSVNTALGEANQDMTKVRDALKARGVADADLQTSGMSIQPNYTQSGSVNGYQVTESLTAVLREMSNAGATISAAAAAGGDATRIDGVSLDLSDPSNGLLATARTNAMADAKAKAQQYASAAGQSLGQVVSITETPVTTPVNDNLFNGAAASAAPSVPVSAGSQQVSVTVTVTYALT